MKDIISIFLTWNSISVKPRNESQQT